MNKDIRARRSFPFMARLALILGCLGIGAAIGAATNAGYTLQRPWPIGGEGKWDLVTLDTGSDRLFVSRATRVQVVDIGSGDLVGEVKNTSGVHGTAVAPEFKRGFTSNGKSDSITVFDLGTLATITELKISGRDPDAILFDASSKHVYAFNAHSNDATVIDAATAREIGSVPLPGRPEFAVSDGRGRIFVNLEDKNALTVIDVEKNAAVSTWPLTSCQGPTGLALDAARHRLFSVCANQRLVVTDSESGRHVAELPIGTHADAAAYDPETMRVYSSNGDSADVTIIDASAGDNYRVLGNISTAKGSKTMALDPRTHRIFVPALLPSGFQVLVVSPGP